VYLLGLNTTVYDSVTTQSCENKPQVHSYYRSMFRGVVRMLQETRWAWKHVMRSLGRIPRATAAIVLPHIEAPAQANPTTAARKQTCGRGMPLMKLLLATAAGTATTQAMHSPHHPRLTLTFGMETGVSSSIRQHPVLRLHACSGPRAGMSRSGSA
jgi:hypothetical protein